jgi:hypothetical protein
MSTHAAVVRQSLRNWGQRYRFRLWETSNVHLVTLDKRSCYDVVLINTVLLADLLEQFQCLKYLALKDLRIVVNRCRVLVGYSRPELEIKLRGCELTDAGTSVLVEVLGRSQGPTKLAYCYIDNVVLADGLRGKNSLKSLSPFVSYNLEVYEREVLVTTGALRENKGLVELELHSRSLRVIEIWGAICHSLETFPTLEILNLRSIETDATMAPAVITSRIQALLNMVKMNLSIHTIHLVDLYSRHELFRD